MNMEECLICGAPLEYLERDEEMECALCHRRERSKTRCQKGHYVCNTCHTRGLDQLVALCRREESRNPWTILEHLMAQPFCHMHGPEHHTMVGAALLTAYRNAGGALDLEQALPEMLRRGSQVPGGACGFWGACGAGISAGMYVSIATGATPLAGEPWGLANGMTSQALARIGAVGGPRCCKRNAHLAIQAAVDFTRANLGVDMEGDAAPCTHFPENNQCLRPLPLLPQGRQAAEGGLPLRAQCLPQPDGRGPGEKVSGPLLRLLLRRDRGQGQDQPRRRPPDEAGPRHRHGERPVSQAPLGPSPSGPGDHHGL